jgi:hypothetical protein
MVPSCEWSYDAKVPSYDIFVSSIIREHHVMCADRANNISEIAAAQTHWRYPPCNVI